MALDTLDPLEEEELARHTRSLVARLLQPEWFRSEVVLAHAHAFFPEADGAQLAAAPLPEGALPATLSEYLSYVLLDFAVVDEALGEVALAHTLSQADSLGLTETFEKVARDELKMTRRAFEDFRRQVPELLSRAAAQPED